MHFFDKILLRKRDLVETVCDKLKNIWLIMQIMIPAIKPLK
jgi:hypothetical protein